MESQPQNPEFKINPETFNNAFSLKAYLIKRCDW